MSSNLKNAKSWAKLEAHRADIEGAPIQSLFTQDPTRFEKFSISLPGLLFDFSKHKTTSETLEMLVSLADERDLKAKREALFSGAPVNASEGRAALHPALRGSCAKDLCVEGENIADFVETTLQKIKTLSDKLRANPQITDVVNIGIGGSDLGPRMVYKALKPYADGPNLYFISNIDASAIHQRLQSLRPENTVFIIASKSFTTLETHENAKIAKDWLLSALPEDRLGEHLIATTARDEAALDFGVPRDHILPMRDWVGGRFSVWGSIGLPLAVAFGFEAFKSFLDGAKAVDTHFKTAPFDRNIPVLMALLGVWYRNFWNYPAQAILPYSHDLRDLPIYMQQLDMESNGKGVTHDGAFVDYATGSVVFGESGTNSQHTFMQLLHQSPEVVPADFIGFVHAGHPHHEQHAQLLANMLAQSKSLMKGRENTKEPHRHFTGNRPSSTLLFDRLDPYHMGMLLALYEHKIFVQGVIWGVNSFDQWGVELGKTNASKIIEALENNQKISDDDASTAGLLHYLSQKFIKS